VKKTQKERKRVMARLSVRLLGSFDVTLGGEAVTGFATDKARALLAYLAVEADRTHRREALAGLLWPDYPEPSARASLRSALVALRRAIGDRETDQVFLHISRQTIQFDCESDAWVDVRAFTDLLDSKVPGAQTIRRLEEAVALYRGDFLEGFSLPDSGAFEEWALLTREMLRRRAVEALEQLVDRYEAAGEYEAALPHAWRQVELDPWRERAQRQLMRQLAFSGQRGAALAQYETCRQILAEELGAKPAPETTALHKRILAGEIVAPAEATGPNLPQQPTPFVGREAVLAEIAERLEDPACRLLTLVGPGGCGKTRLALEAAAAQLERYPHGVYFISLAPLDAVEAILPTVADAIGFTFYEGGEPQQQLLDYLRGKRMLLIMDNYEHLLDPRNPPPLSPPVGGTEGGGGAALVTDILRTAPDVKVLATSRARLNVGGEFRYPVSGMLYPDLETSALGWDDHVHRAVGAAHVLQSADSCFCRARAGPGRDSS
jgi:DNA-binding SARP family transcriptional activator